MAKFLTDSYNSINNKECNHATNLKVSLIQTYKVVVRYRMCYWISKLILKTYRRTSKNQMGFHHDLEVITKGSRCQDAHPKYKIDSFKK